MWRSEPPSDAAIELDDPILEQLQDLLIECVSYKTENDLETRNSIPMYRFVIHMSIKPEKIYASKDSMTQTIAMMQYITRGVLLMEGHRVHRYVLRLLLI
jgi:hypothetical protein